MRSDCRRITLQAGARRAGADVSIVNNSSGRKGLHIMCRKIGIAAVLAAAGLFLINRAGLSSYTATAWNNVRSSFKKQVPLEFEIERLRYQVQQLVPDMKRQLKEIA